VTDGLAHKVAGAAGEEFHRLHEECLYQVLKGDRTCPLCHERVTSIDHESVNDSESGDEDGDYLCGLYMHMMESEKIRTVYTDVIDAAKKGESLTLYKLLNGLENPVPYQKKAVRTAAAYGHNDIVRTLLNGCTHFENSNDTLSGMDALISGAWGGNIEIVRETLIRYPSIKRDGAVCAAAEKGQTEVLELLLSNATISNAVRQRAIKEALQNRHTRGFAFIILLGSITRT